MDAVTVTSLIQVTLCGVFALFVLVRNYRSSVNLLFALGMISLACLVAGDYMTFQDEWNSVKWKKLVMVSETIFPMSWLLFSLRYGGVKRRPLTLSVSILSVTASIFLSGAALYYPLDSFMSSPQPLSGKVIRLEPAGYYFYLVVVVTAITAMVRLESTLWASRGGTRWSVKYAVLGVGGLLGIFIYYYSHPILYRSIDMSLASARNAVFIVSTVLLVAAFLRQRFLDVEVFVSRRIVFRSVVFLAIGLYFIFLGIFGEGMRYLGEDLSRNLVLFLVFFGIIGFLVLLLAESFRRKAKRFITDNFYRNRYEYKDEWLKFTEKLSSANSMNAVLDEVLDIMVETFGVKGASYWACSQEENICSWSRSTRAGQRRDAIFSMDSLLVRDASTGAIYDRNNKVSRIEQEHSGLFTSYGVMAVIPVRSSDRLLGLIMLGESIPGISYDEEDYELMLTFSGQGAYAIEKTRLAAALAESKEMEAMGKVISFVMHDLKNMTTSLSMLLENAEEYIGHPDFQKDMVKTVKSSVERMSKVMRKLSHLRETHEIQMSPVNIQEVVEEVTSGMVFPPDVRVEFENSGSPPVLGDRNEIRKILVNLLLNAVESMGGESGRIRVSAHMDDNNICVKISDTGCGMSRDFMEGKLFKPFRTTKRGGLGIGLYHCRAIVKAHGGRLDVDSREGEGSTFSIYLPLAEGQGKNPGVQL